MAVAPGGEVNTAAASGFSGCGGEAEGAERRSVRS